MNRRRNTGVDVEQRTSMDIRHPAKTAFLGIALAVHLANASPSLGADEGGYIERIAFGSCSRQDWPQPLWSAVVANDPDLWIWLGDNIYADTADTSVMRAKYHAQLQRPEYQQLLRLCPLIGTWDDHDYGRNNGGKEFEAKRESQALLLDFLGEPAASQRRRQEGVYAAYTYGPPQRRIQVILLDTRYHREEPGPEADVLGDAQWSWLENTLTDSAAALHIVASSIQVLPEDHQYEKWANFPKSRERLFRTIGRARTSGVLFLSGDRHLAEISRMTHPEIDYPLYEVTSSGMTHSYTSLTEEPNRHRLGEFHKELNYGVLDFRWTDQTLEVELQVRQRNGGVALREVVEYPRAAEGRD